MLRVTTSGSSKKTHDFLKRLQSRSYLKGLSKYGPIGVAALSAATPVDSAETAHAWSYGIIDKPGYYCIYWTNSHFQDGAPIAVMLQYGHATGNGGFVQGRDYINPVMKRIFDQIRDDMWREVTK